jgi:lipopolysaccharide transport system ATP-binding protein
VSNVNKRFHRYLDRPWTIQEAVARGLRWAKAEHFWALRDVSFRVSAGKAVGIIGSNGSGKSTLLRLIGGVGRPDGGSINVHGRIGALLDLGAGFHSDLTGRENAILAGLLNGLTRRQVLDRLTDVVKFADVERVINDPVRTYSTGMQMRLAFATAVHTEPDILLIDEVLSVGDLAFQHKCLERIAQFRRAGCSILLVSHEAAVIRAMCDEAVWLNKGRLMAQGPAGDVVRQYVEFMEGGGIQLPPGVEEAASASGSIDMNESAMEALDNEQSEARAVELKAIRVLDSRGRPAATLQAGDALRVEIEYQTSACVMAPIFCVRVTRDDGVVCYVLTTEGSNLSLPSLEGRGQVALDLERLDVNSGVFWVDASCYPPDWMHPHDYKTRVASFAVRGDGMQESVLNSPFRWELRPSRVAVSADPVESTGPRG